MAKTTIDLSGLGGLAPRFYGDYPLGSANPQLRTLGKAGMFANGIVNPIAKLGYLSPANNTTVAAGGVSALIGSSIVDTINSKGYMAGRGIELLRFDSLTDVTVETHNITASTVITDLEFYTVNGVRKLFYSYLKSGGGNVGIFDLNATYNDTWLSGTCANGSTVGDSNATYPATDVKLVLADNGFMYVLDMNAIHKIDGTSNGGANGTASMNVITFPLTFRLIDAVDLRGKMYVTLSRSTRDINAGLTNESVYSEQCGVYVWDRESTRVNMTDYIPVDGVRELRSIFSYKGIPMCFSVSTSGYTQLRRFTGNDFKVVRELGKNAYPRFKDSIHVDGDLIYWQGNDGLMYVYGNPDPMAEEALYKIGDMTQHVTAAKSYSAGGAIMCMGGTDSGVSNNTYPMAFYVAFQDTNTSYLIKKWYPHAYTPYTASNSPLAGGFYSMVKQLPKLSRVKSVTLFYPKTTTTGTTQEMTANLYFNQSATAWNGTAISLTRDDGSRGYKYIQVGQKAVNAIQIGLNYDVDSTLGTSKIHPQYAEVEYDDGTGERV